MNTIDGYKNSAVKILKLMDEQVVYEEEIYTNSKI